ncbi:MULTISPECIES: 16S rRNA (uracil(1498)-N(3))-methyltransferase [Devosia]|mgnify:FL=1|jgi:16S rRNA (uracil1498-N3)-methyltransferase|uniref:Ribosomal RNA small subunit methyltransferase E n=2 Tax=Devosia TaxID=46913 RepID=A0A942IE92_9HYPH|nr:MULTISPECIES: 16S rRNA (uracil(1498)-N(3))-methyltransferase [Devosia]MBS3849384.1 16S rRNA (uracil(1498)-N(3))-methyltransferase [Devosia litorisediminis]MCZ4344614.1 16S rRNA (uracil(1498)-N(3))-methyltransferase [Devosia neptuniae]|tara:strand:- start:2581 stop:3321 length:741 start_codon:yes stop_codon:yes gene_type:complete
MPRTHASLPRLYVEPDLSAGAQLTLGKEQSLYLAAVLRKSVGDEVVLFNGRDGAWLCRLISDSKKSVQLELVERIAGQTPVSDLWYGFAPLKSERLDYVIQKAVEMGVGTIQPVITRYTQVNRLKHERMVANAIEAAEQCEVLSVPSVEPEMTLERLIDGWPADRTLILADESAASSSPVETLGSLKGHKVGILIGPEGGFSDEERAKLIALPYVVPISLGPRILRADTAAVAALAVIQAIIGDWR